MLANQSEAVLTASPAADTPKDFIGRVAVFASEEESEAALRAGLARIAEDIVFRRGNIRQAVRFFEKETSAAAVVVDIDGTEDPLAALEDLARVCPPDVTVVAIGENSDIGLYRALVQEIGVTEYLPKPLTRDSVQRLMLRHFMPDHAEAQPVRGGYVVAVCGATGGAGASTIAVSLSIELAGATKANTALLDLNLQGGAAALMFGARPGPGLRTALEDPGRADALFLERTAINLEPRLRLIAADEALGADMQVTEAGISRVLDLMRQKFNYIVVDLPKPLPPAMRYVIARARQVVIVLEPDVLALRNGRAIRSLVTAVAGTDRAITVLNRADRKGGLRPAMLEKALGAAPEIALPDLGKRMTESLNLGVPAVRRIPELKKQLSPLVREIAGVRTGAFSNSWLKRLRGR